MGLFTKMLDTVLESGTVPPQSNGSDTGSFNNSLPPSQAVAATPNDPAGVTATYHGPAPGGGNNHIGTVQQWQEVEKMREQAKAAKIGALSVDQKIDLALKQSENAEKIAHRTAGAVSAIDRKLDRTFQNLTTMIGRIGQGKPATEPDPPGSSIWDDNEDQESIFGR
jgi:hypothetical protein